MPDENRPPRPLKIVPFGGGGRGALYAGRKALGDPASVTFTHENATLGADGSINSAAPGVMPDQATVQAITAGPRISLGNFVSSLAAAPPGRAVAGPAPTPPQQDILRLLGLAESYQALATPKTFARIISCQPQPDSAYRAFIGRLRAAANPSVPAIAALLPPPGADTKFSLRNRASLTAWLRTHRATLLDADAAAFAPTAQALAQATLVILADPAQSALLGLCAPGVKILEIAPEGWVTTKPRAYAGALGHQYHLFLASAPSYPLLQNLPFGAGALLGYEIPIGALARALKFI